MLMGPLCTKRVTPAEEHEQLHSVTGPQKIYPKDEGLRTLGLRQKGWYSAESHNRTNPGDNLEHREEMCIGFFAVNPSPGIQFILAFNRDEFLERPTQPTHFWPDQDHILAGRDLVGGGTWLAVGNNGRIAFLTNLRAHDVDPDEAAAEGTHYRTRGELPAHFINSHLSPSEYLKSLEGKRYAGFNLVCVDLARKELAYSNNAHACKQTGRPALTSDLAPLGSVDGAEQSTAQAGTSLAVQELEVGTVYGLSNGLLNEWSKVKAGIPVLEALLQGREVHSSSSGQPSQPAEAPGSSGSGGEAGPSDSCGRPDMTLASKPIPGANDAVDRGEAEGQSAGQSGGSSLEPGGELSGVDWDRLFTTLLGDQAKEEQLQPTDDQGGPLPASKLSADDHLEYVASSRFISPVPSKFGAYGTRSQIVVAVSEDGASELRERYLDPQGRWRSERHAFTMAL